MKHLKTLVLACLMSITMLLVTESTAQTQQKNMAIAVAAEKARPSTVRELYALFRNRTWVWKDGAGYFAASKRIFTSWVGNGKQASYAKGVWFLTVKGELCFRAVWVGKDNSTKAFNCFEHRTDGKHLYQRRVPAGDWYIFAHWPSRANDEVRKLRLGDRVRRGYARNKKTVERNTGQKRLIKP